MVDTEEEKREKRNEALRKYRQTPKGKETLRKYRQSPKGKETLRKYRQSPKAKETARKYRQSPKGKEVQRKSSKIYTQSPKGKEALRKYRHSPEGKEARRKYEESDEWPYRKNWVLRYDTKGEIIINSEKKPRLPKWLKEVLEVGFVRKSGSSSYFRLNRLKNIISVFDVSGTGRKYKPEDFFGASHRQNDWWYQTKNTQPLIDYLEKLLILNNPNVEKDQAMRKAFTMLIHANGLHWSGCWHHDKKGGKIN